jgi:hypothetical protein
MVDGEIVGEVVTIVPGDIYPKRANQMCVFSKTDLLYGEYTVRIINVEYPLLSY